MLRYQFLYPFLKALFFIKIVLKLIYFCKKMQNFRALGAPPPDPGASGGWGLHPQTPNTAPPHCEFLATRLQVGKIFRMDIQQVLRTSET